MKIASVLFGSAGLAMAASVAPQAAVAQEPSVGVPPKPPVTWIASPHFDDRPPGTGIDTILLHDTETPGISLARTIASHFANPRSGVSAHFIIGKGGEIVQCVPEEKRAFHAGPSLFRGRERVNDFSLGIELVNAQTGRDPFTAPQYASLGSLVRHLAARFAIPRDRIVGHHDVTNRPGVKRDPAINFDWDRFLASLGPDPAAEARRQVVENREARRLRPM
ncbi:MAG: N-acetylmuramoyl-L-alanine amidase [Candidatus Sericytochromatia bacterium]|nr:N-acetylmuramoyl-L-alanine amidase [Candidatus Tanganyikabacteria bacterium]